MTNMRCLDVRYSANGSTIWIPLPREAWEVCGLCQCDNCKGRIGFWDTMAVAATPSRHNLFAQTRETMIDPTGFAALSGVGHTFLVHQPERHPFHTIETIRGNDAWTTGRGFYTDPLAHPALRAKLDSYVEQSKAQGLTWEVERVEHAIAAAVAPMPHNPDVVPS